MFHFYFDNLKFIPKYSCAVVQTLSKLHGNEFFWFGKKCDPASDKLHAALYKLTLTWISTCSGYLDSFCEIGTHQITLRSLTINELCHESNGSDVIRNAPRKCHNEIQYGLYSALYVNTVCSEIWSFVSAIHLAGVRGETCGALRQKVHHVHPLNVLLPQHRDWSSEF